MDGSSSTTRTSRRTELYHLARDPAESNDLVAREPDKARELVRLLEAFDLDNARRSHWRKGQEGIPEDVLEGLRALGYVR